jgi:hypothetical protein
MPATCDRLWYMKEKHISILAREFPDIDVAQFKACVTCTATVDRDQVPSLSSSDGFTFSTLILGSKDP